MIQPESPAWLRDLQRPPASIPADATRPAPLLLNARHEAIATPAAWKARREELRRAWVEFLGTIPKPQDPPEAKQVAAEEVDGVVRQLVRYEGEPGLPVEAYVLRPKAIEQRRPGAVVLHSTVPYTIRQPAGLEGPSNVHIGMHLAKRGFVAVCPRCFLWEYAPPGRGAEAVAWLERRHPHVRGMAKMLFDAQRALDLLATQPDVDPGRLGAIGHSLGAKEVLYLAAFDDRVRATVSCEGGIGLTYSNWDAPWYLGDAIRRPGFGLDHGQVLALAAPRAFLLVGGDSADGDRSWPYIEAALPVWKLLGVGDAVGLLNHHQGHAFPADVRKTAYQWLDWFLRAP